jgi:hypothetical protein
VFQRTELGRPRSATTYITVSSKIFVRAKFRARISGGRRREVERDHQLSRSGAEMRSVARGQAVSTLWETKIRVLALTVACVFASTVLARVSTTSTAVPDSSLAGYDTPGKVAATADGSLAAKVPVNAPADTTATPSSSEATRSPDSGLPDAPEAKAINAYTRPGYVRPSEKSRLKNYLLGAWGPLPLVSSAMVSGITQAEGNPHEWGGGLGGYGRRWGSNYGMAAVTTTTRYGLARLTGEDTLYYRCECTGFLPRLKHAMYSTVTGRRGEDGHRIFSVPSVVAPYVGAMTAVYGWYPGRYDYKDAVRMGNYNLLIYAGNNVVLEFFPSSKHSLLARWHLQNRHAAPDDAR